LRDDDPVPCPAAEGRLEKIPGIFLHPIDEILLLLDPLLLLLLSPRLLFMIELFDGLWSLSLDFPVSTGELEELRTGELDKLGLFSSLEMNLGMKLSL